jgi:two-component system chemotaxis response regulator CheB
MINVIVVDDSAFMRKSITMMLESDPEIKVVATARDGMDGIEKIRRFKPDLVTLDVEMPTMDGLTALGIIMKEMPLPVLMISSVTTEGAAATIEALSLGAADFISKDMSFVSVEIVKIKEDLISKVKHIAASRAMQFRLQRIRTSASGVKATPGHSSSLSSRVVTRRPTLDLRAVVIGISTGGPFALLQMLPKLPKNFPLGIVIVQHMPPNFTRSMAERLDSQCQLDVREAKEGDKVQAGLVLIAPGGKHMTFTRHGINDVRTKISDEPRTTLYKPCADVMMLSAVEAFSGPLLGLIMTGMGKDGLEAAKVIKKRGGFMIAQGEESCVVYGMPKAIVDEGLADAVLALDDIPSGLIQTVTNKPYDHDPRTKSIAVC